MSKVPNLQIRSFNFPITPPPLAAGGGVMPKADLPGITYFII
jgi:hypothetical protein